MSYTNAEYRIALQLAYKKLNRIIAMYGDGNGERKKLYYIAELVAEQITQNDMAISLKKRKEHVVNG